MSLPSWTLEIQVTPMTPVMVHRIDFVVHARYAISECCRRAVFAHCTTRTRWFSENMHVQDAAAMCARTLIRTGGGGVGFRRNENAHRRENTDLFRTRDSGWPVEEHEWNATRAQYIRTTHHTCAPGKLPRMYSGARTMGRRWREIG